MKKTIVTKKMLDTLFEQLSESEQEARRAWNVREANLDFELRQAREYVKDVCKNLLDPLSSGNGTSETIPDAGWIQPLKRLYIQLEALNLGLASYGLRISFDGCNDRFGLPKIHWRVKKFQRSKALRLASKLCHFFSSKLLEKEKGENKDSLFEDLKKTLASSLSTFGSVLGKHRETISGKVLSEAVFCLCEKLCEEARAACETRCKHCGKIQPAGLLCVAEDLSLLCKECAAASGLPYKDPAEDGKLFQNAERIPEADETEEGL